MESVPVSRKIRVLVADTSRLHSQLLTDALQQDPDLVVVSWDPNSSSLISAVAAQEVDVLAMSSGLGGRSSERVKMVRDVHSRCPQTRIVVLLDSQDAQLVTDAFRAGARGVFGRESSVEMFRKCVRSVHRGEIWADHREISLAVNALASVPVIRTVDSGGVNLLSKREFEVVECVVQGMTNREIAQHLRLSQHTVKNYLFRVFDKLGVSSRVELLFMTIGRSTDSANPNNEPLFDHVWRQIFTSRTHDSATVALLEKAANEGGTAAQVSLAQALAVQGGTHELGDAYMWLLIAGEQTRQERAQLAKRLSSQQIEEAERKATLRSTRIKQAVPASFVTGSPAREADRRDQREAVLLSSAAEAPRPQSLANGRGNEARKKSVAGSHAPSDEVLRYGSA
jgi:two-component system, NarL family, nitrate/nitrite response regulator NarL